MAEPTTDPRPRVTDGPEPLVSGSRCTACGYPMAFPRPMCPVCGGEAAPAAFGPSGSVFSSTVIRIPVGDRQPPYALAYVDLEEGPRILARMAGDEAAAPTVGARVRLRGMNAEGDPVVEVLG